MQANLRFAASQGGIAQLGERLHGMQEVIGSIPFTSTKDFWKFLKFFVLVVEKSSKRVFCRVFKSPSGKFQGSDPIV